jgi:molybdopterin converting factor small subunit
LKAYVLSKFFSFSAAPGRNYLEVTKRLSDSPFSRALVALKPGDEVLLEVPMGESYLRTVTLKKEEGFEEIVTLFKEIAEVEEEYKKRYRKLLKNVKEGKVFKRDVPVKWKCRNCGYIHEGNEAPKACPACAHPQSYYEVFCKP